jgi:tRNA modification GTPase
MSEQDTICAVSTPLGSGGIGIIRISGRSALDLAKRVFCPRSGEDLSKAASHSIHYGTIRVPVTGEVVDESLVTVMRAPRTYTREDTVEINCHGGSLPLWRTMRLLIEGGGREAEPGEFTKRAFLNGRIDLAQAEAVMEIIQAQTEMSHRAATEQLMGGLSREVARLRERLIAIVAGVEAAIDFPEDEIDTPLGEALEREVAESIRTIDELVATGIYGRVLREGLAAAIVGRPNVGKSSLLNALLRQDRAIVTEHPGTTRDVLEEALNVKGIQLRILDTAGIRESLDVAEREGVKRSLDAVRRADVVLLVLDGSMPLSVEDEKVLAATRDKDRLIVINKSDLPRLLGEISLTGEQVLVSCRNGEGLDELRRILVEVVRRGSGPPREHAWAVNQRHQVALERAKASLERATVSLRDGLSPEFMAIDLREALDHVGFVIGATYTEDILSKIFDDFCIGK